MLLPIFLTIDFLTVRPKRKCKRKVHPKIKILSSFTHPHVVQTERIDFLCWTQKKIFYIVLVTRQFTEVIDLIYIFPTMQVNGCRQLSGYQHSLKYLFCSAEEINSYRFWTTWGWCCWTIPLQLFMVKYLLRKYDWRMSNVFADFGNL